jgi:hypothetical protein
LIRKKFFIIILPILEIKLISAVSGVIERNASTIDINLDIGMFLLDRHHPGGNARA